MIYIKIALIIIATFIIIYIYSFIKMNREAISNVMKSYIAGTNPFFVYAIFRMVLRMIRRFFIKF